MTAETLRTETGNRKPQILCQFWDGVVLFAVFLWCFPAALKLAGAYFIDLRYQVVSAPADYSLTTILVIAGTLLLLLAIEMILLKSGGGSYGTPTGFLAVNLPLAVCAWLWFQPATFTAMMVILPAVCWTAGRAASAVSAVHLPEISSRKAATILAAAVFLYAFYGTLQQVDSFNKLAMQWLDWGHFYEMLNNFRSGRPFHLNLSYGSFLGSRFCPVLVILLPIVYSGCIPLFFFAGSLFVASGAIFVWLIAREHKFSNTEALLWGMWYLLIPGIVNMNLPLLDGFHEVFLLFPLSFAAWWFYLKKQYIPAAVMILLSFGVRETVGFMYIGWGAVLFFSGKRKSGILLAVTAALITLLIIKIAMPFFRPPIYGSYDHTVFFPHLGSSLTEIALSPLTRPEAFWGTLFSRHNLYFWLMLFLPFAPAAAAPLLLLPMTADLVMVCVDNRFDSQTVLRHYQTAMLITAVIAAIEGSAKLKKSEKAGHFFKYIFAGIPGKTSVCRGMTAMAFAGAVAGSLMLTQIPGLPASDPRLPEWEDARPVMARFKALLPPGAKVTAGPRIASQLVGYCDLFFDYETDESWLEDYVFIENFSTMYDEDTLSRYLLAAPNWELLHQEYLGERSLQLFKRVKNGKAVKPPRPLTAIQEEQWQKTGSIIPSPVAGVELRGVMGSNNRIIILARLTGKQACDLGLRTTLTYADGTKSRHFTSFGKTLIPADMAKPGDVYIFDVPFSGEVTGCKVDITMFREYIMKNGRVLPEKRNIKE